MRNIKITIEEIDDGSTGPSDELLRATQTAPFSGFERLKEDASFLIDKFQLMSDDVEDL